MNEYLPKKIILDKSLIENKKTTSLLGSGMGNYGVNLSDWINKQILEGIINVPTTDFNFASADSIRTDLGLAPRIHNFQNTNLHIINVNDPIIDAGGSTITLDSAVLNATGFMYDSPGVSLSPQATNPGIPFFNDSRTLWVNSSNGHIYAGATDLNAIAAAGNNYIVGGYPVLRSTTSSTLSDMIYVEDWTYTGVDGNTYTTKGGTFRKVSTGSENGGTLIISADGQRWKRDYETIIPEFWECAISAGTGYDETGASYIDKNTSSAGIYNDTDRIQAATIIAGNGTISFENSSTYVIDKDITVTNNQRWIGYGSTLQLTPEISSTLTVAASIGATSVTVTDVTPFRVGQRVLIFDNSATNGGEAFDENSGTTNAHIISNITGNVITFTFGIDKAMGIGDTLAVTNGIIGCISDSFSMEGITLDGNEGNSHFTRDWRLNQLIVARIQYGFSAQNCTFINAPSGVYTGAGADFINCQFIDCMTSITHSSSNTSGNPKQFIRVVGCNGDNIGSKSYLATHSEAIFTCSFNVTGYFIQGGRWNDIYCSILGNMTDTTKDITIRDAIFIGQTDANNNGRYIISGGTSGVSESLENINLINNTFINCGDILLNGNNNSIGDSVYDINIKDNTIVNCRAAFSQCSRITISGNRWYSQNINGFVAATHWTAPLVTDNAMIRFRSCYEVNVSNNNIYGPETFNTFVGSAILVRLFDNGGTTVATYHPEKNYKIINNLFHSFSGGFTSAASGFSVTNLRAETAVVDWLIKDNTLVERGDQAWAGFVGHAGSTLINNTVFSNTTSTGYYPFVFLGVSDNTFGNTSELLGCLAFDNKNIGASIRSCYVGSTAFSSNNNIRGIRNMFTVNPVGPASGVTMYAGATTDPRANYLWADLLNVGTGATILEPEYQRWNPDIGYV